MLKNSLGRKDTEIFPLKNNAKKPTELLTNVYKWMFFHSPVTSTKTKR